MTIHAHLAVPDPSARTYGELTKPGDHWRIEAEPSVIEVAKRVFPGSARSGRGAVEFPDSKRQVEELLWLMLRFPLRMDRDTSDLLMIRREEAIELAANRENRRDRPIIVDAKFRGTLLEYQKIGAAFVVDNKKCLLGDEMGLGKTVQAIAAMASVNQWPWIIVVEPNIVRQWQAQLDTFLEPRLGGWAHAITGTKAAGVIPEAPCYIIHYHLLRHWVERLMALRPVGLIFDEVQNLRCMGSQKYSAASKLSDGIRNVWGMSGTPIYNYGMEIWAIFNAIDHYCLGGSDGFGREWATEYGSKIIEKPAELGDYLKREGLMLRRLKSDVAAQLPPKRRLVQQIDHDEGVFADLIAHAVSCLAEYDKAESYMEKGRIARLIDVEARRATGVSKAPIVADFVRSLVEAGERPIVFAHHHDVHDILLERLSVSDREATPETKANAIEITGRRSQKEKDDAIKSFAAGESRVAVLGLRSTAGLDNLQGAGTCVVFAELDWSPAVHAQCEDRLHRIGMKQQESLLCYYLVCRAGSDEQMQEALGLKIDQFKGIMGEKVQTPDDEALGAQVAFDRMKAVIEKLRQIKKRKKHERPELAEERQAEAAAAAP